MAKGRPKDLIPKDQIVKARVTDKTKQRFEYIANRLDVSQSDLFRGLVDGAFEHLSLVDRLVGGSAEQQQEILRGHVLGMWKTFYLYAEATSRLGLLDVWEQVTKEYLKIVQEVREHGRMLSPEERARPASSGGSQPDEGTICTLETLDSNKEGQTYETEKT